MLYPVILAGGSGTRLWPWSRDNFPKQFLRVDDRKSLLQNCLHKVRNPQQFHSPYIVINHKHSELLKKINANIIIEPRAKGTAPAITLAALALYQQDKEAVMLAIPADIHIKNNKLFRSLVTKSEELALKRNKLILFGIQALYPETGYGYIKCGRKRSMNLFEITHFIEKPPLDMAKKYIAEGDLWNCGIFIFPTNLLLNEIKKHAPEIYHNCLESFAKAKIYAKDNKLTYYIDPTIFHKCPIDSIDYSVLEKSSNLEVLKSNIDWKDIGSWQAMYELGRKDADGNILRGEVIAIDCKNTHVINNNPGEIITLMGSKNLTVVKSGNATLIMPRKECQKVKQIVALLEKKNKHRYLNT